MIKNSLKTGAILFASLFLTFCSSKDSTCIIKGKVIGRSSDTILLHRITDDIRFNQVAIPIVDSTFEYTLKFHDLEAYELVFKDELDKGSWQPITIFPEKGTVECVLYSPDNYKKNQVLGGKLNAEYLKFQDFLFNTYMAKAQVLNDSIDALLRKNEYYSVEMSSIMNNLNNEKDNAKRTELSRKIGDLRKQGNDLSPKAKTINLKGDSLRQELLSWRSNYIKENPTIVSYYFLLTEVQQIKFIKVDLDQAKNNLMMLSKHYPDHPYYTYIKNLIESEEKIKIGEKFIDFTLPDIDGRMHTLSEEIKNRVALIDLWASWCGPCIVTSRSMIPVYEEFKDKGFTICGVAAEIKNTDQMRFRLEKEQFPWTNLVDLDNRNLIWYKYGIPNSGGATFLVDADGKFLAINPTAEEVRNILIEKLK